MRLGSHRPDRLTLRPTPPLRRTQGHTLESPHEDAPRPAAENELLSAEGLSLDELCELIQSPDSEGSPTMPDATAVILRFLNERTAPEEERAWLAWRAQYPEDAKELATLRQEALALLREARTLAARAARIRLLD